MPTVDFPVRLVFDEFFYNSLIKANPKLLNKLMYINARAKGNKRTFNVLSKKTFKKILKDNPSMPEELLRASFCPFEEEALEEISGDIERTVKYAVHVVEENPKKKSLILTSEENVENYLKNSHYINSKDVSVKGGEDTIKIIEEFWKDCTNR